VSVETYRRHEKISKETTYLTSTVLVTVNFVITPVMFYGYMLMNPLYLMFKGFPNLLIPRSSHISYDTTNTLKNVGSYGVPRDQPS
jgi:hypothetical protein